MTPPEALAASAAGLEVEPDVLFQDAAHGLVAASERVDLLVMGSAAHGPAHSVTLGGVTREVTASAACPVLVLPRDAANVRWPTPGTRGRLLATESIAAGEPNTRRCSIRAAQATASATVIENAAR